MNARAAAIGLWLAMVALCAAQVARTHFVADLSSFLPAEPTAAERVLVDQLRHGPLSRVMLVGIDGATPAARAAISRELARALSSDAHFGGVANGDDGGRERERELLFAHRYVLSPAVDAARFSEEGLRGAIGATLDLLASSAGLAVKSLLTRDPTGETLVLIDALQPSRSPRLVDGTWTTADGNTAVLLARTRESGADIDAQARALAALEDAFEHARTQAGAAASGARLVVTGPGVFSVRARAMIQHDVARLTTLSAVLVVSLLLAVYRSPRLLALGFVPVVSGALAGIAAVSLAFGNVHGITLGFGTTLIGEAVDYSIYLFVQSEGGALRDPRWRARFWPTIRLGVLTSIAGFLALVFSKLQGLAQLGVYSITGLVVAAAVTRFVLPSLAPERLRVRDLTRTGTTLARYFVGRRALRAVAIVAVAAAIAAILAHRAAPWDRDLASLNPITAADRESDRRLREALGASDARVMLALPAASREAALESAQRAQAALDPLVASGGLAGYDSPAALLPPEATQRQRQASLPDAPTLRGRLRAALAGMPLRAERLEPFVADVESARRAPLLTAHDLDGTALGLALDSLLTHDDAGRWTALVGLHAAQGREIEPARVERALRDAHLQDAVVLDVKAQLDAIYGGYFQRALVASAAGVAVIGMLLLASLRDVRRLFSVIAPFAAGVAIAAGVQLALGATLTLFHLVGMLLVAAIGSNYSLFFDRLAHAREPGAARTIASLTLANATTVIGFGLLALSSIPVLHAIGSTVAIGTFATLAIAAAFAPRGIGLDAGAAA